MGVSAAILAAAAVGAGATYYSTEEQKNIAEQEQRRLDKEEADRKKEAERIARDTRPEGEAATSVKFGAGQDTTVGSTQDFLIPKSGAVGLGGTTSGSGLGFSV